MLIDYADVWKMTRCEAAGDDERPRSWRSKKWDTVIMVVMLSNRKGPHVIANDPSINSATTIAKKEKGPAGSSIVAAKVFLLTNLAS